MTRDDLKENLNTEERNIEAILAKAQLHNAKREESASNNPVCLELSLEHFVYREHYLALLTSLEHAAGEIANYQNIDLKAYVKVLLSLIQTIDSCLEERQLYLACLGVHDDELAKELLDLKEYLYFEILVSENTDAYYQALDEAFLRLASRLEHVQKLVTKEVLAPALLKHFPAGLVYLVNAYSYSLQELPEAPTGKLDIPGLTQEPEVQQFLLRQKFQQSLAHLAALDKSKPEVQAVEYELGSNIALARADMLAHTGTADYNRLRYLYRLALLPHMEEKKLKSVLFRYFVTFFVEPKDLPVMLMDYAKGELAGKEFKLKTQPIELLKGCFEAYSNLGHRNTFGETLLQAFTMLPFGAELKAALAGFFNITTDDETLLGRYLQASFEGYTSVMNEFRSTLFSIEGFGEQTRESLAKLLAKDDEEGVLPLVDKEYLHCYLDILNSVSCINSYNASTHLEVDVQLLQKAKIQAQTLIEKGLSCPTALFHTCFHRRLLQLQHQLTTEIKKAFLYVTPKLSLRIAKQEQEAEQNTWLYCQIKNEKGMQQAEDLELLLLTTSEASYNAEQLQLEAVGVPGDGKEYEFKIKVPADLSACISIELKLGYSYIFGYHNSEPRLVRREASFKLDMPQSQQGFREIDNVYAPICTSNAVVDPKMMFGRAELISKLTGAIDFNQPKSVVLWGQKRTGKSTVLLHLQRALEEKFTADELLLVPCDAMSKIDIDSCNDHKEVMLEIKKLILKGIRKAIKEKAELMEELDDMGCNMKPMVTSKNANERFEEFFDAYAELEIKPALVLFIDEFTVLYNWIKQGKLGLSFIKWWREFLYSNKISAYIVGQDYMQQFIELDPNGFGNVEKYKVNYLTREHTLELIQKPIWLQAENKSRYLENAAENIYELSAGSAFYTVIICKTLVDYLNSRRLSLVTDAVVQATVHELLYGQQALGQDIFEALYNNEGCFADERHAKDSLELCRLMAKFSSTVKQKVSELEIKRLAMERLKLSSERVDQLLEDLTKRDVLIKEGGSYAIRVHLFHEWLKNKA